MSNSERAQEVLRLMLELRARHVVTEADREQAEVEADAIREREDD